MLALVPKTSTCVVSVSQGEFVVKVHPAAPPRHAPLQPHQQSAAALPRRAARESSSQQTRVKNTRQLRSVERATKHAAKRRSSRLRLQGLLHRHLWQQRGRQHMQDVWTAWSRGTALPPPTPASPPSRSLQIVDPRAFPALPTAPASAGPRKREVSGSPPSTSPTSTLVKKPRKLRGYYHEAAAAPPAAAPPITTVFDTVRV